MKSITFDELKKAWTSYENTKVLRVLINGKWETRPATDSQKNISATKAVFRPIAAVLTFPEYLEKMWPTTPMK